MQTASIWELLPTLSVIIVTLNCARNLDICLSAIRAQVYPANKLEIIVVDGGSTDDTLKVAERYGARVIVADQCPRYRINAEARMAIGLQHAQNEIIAYIMSDNFLPSPDWLKQMVHPLMEDGSIIATQTLRYTYRSTDTLVNRYFALFGVSDPVAYYLNKRDRISWAENSWCLPGKAEDKGTYYRVRFQADGLPPLGCNGALVRREILLKSECTPDLFRHSDVMYDLVVMGYDTFGIVKNDVIHATSDTIFGAVRKRIVYFQSLHPGWEVERRYLLFDPKRREDRLRLVWFVLASLTLVKPTWDAFKGFLRIRDMAWFLNPIMCLAMTFAYGLAYLLRSRIWLVRLLSNVSHAKGAK